MASNILRQNLWYHWFKYLFGAKPLIELLMMYTHVTLRSKFQWTFTLVNAFENYVCNISLLWSDFSVLMGLLTPYYSPNTTSVPLGTLQCMGFTQRPSVQYYLVSSAGALVRYHMSILTLNVLYSNFSLTSWEILFDSFHVLLCPDTEKCISATEPRFVFFPTARIELTTFRPRQYSQLPIPPHSFPHATETARKRNTDIAVKAGPGQMVTHWD